MPDARYVREFDAYTPLAANATSVGEVWQLADGQAGYQVEAAAKSASDYPKFKSSGIAVFTKSTGVAILDGGRVYWDHSANAATFRAVNDRDFYIGRAVGDATTTDAFLYVNTNIGEFDGYAIDLLRDGALSVPVGTQAVGAFGYPKPFGGALGIELTATNEAQKIDLLSVDRRAVASNPIAEFIIRIAANGSTNAVDLSVGLANDTHASDADSITESVFFHIDGGSTAINAESDDGTTEVAATDTTTTFTAGSAVANRKELWIDARDPASVKLYVDGVRVLTGTTFVLSAATGPLGLLVHLEKTSSTATAGPVYLDRALLRTSEQ